MSHGIGAGANRKVDVPLCFCNTRAANVSRIGPGANNKAVVFVCFALFAFRALYSSHFASRPAVVGGGASRAASMDVIGWCFKRLSALQHNTVVSQDRQGPPLARDYFGDFLLLRSSRGWMQKWIRANPHIIEGRHARTHGRADTNQLYDSVFAGLYCVPHRKL